MLHEFLAANRAAIIARTRARAAARAAPVATADELDSGIPLFLDQLIDALQVSLPQSDAMGASASRHGRDLLKRGFTVAQVVHDYGGVCQSLTELAGELNAPITADEFQAFNRCLDDSIAQAVTEYVRLREQVLVDQGTERLGNLSHELRNALGAAVLAFQTLRSGSVGISGSTGSLLDRSLRRACALIDSSIAAVRLEAGLRSAERVSMDQFLEEVEVGASMEASALGLALSVTRPTPDLNVFVDRELLAGAVMNLVQNAFKFTRPKGRVALTTSSSADRVRIEVEDQCGGLPPGKAVQMFRPFDQSSTNRKGLGLGLSISRQSIEAIGGTLDVRDVPSIGCVFTIDLPRLSLPSS